MSVLFWNDVALEIQRRDVTPGGNGALSIVQIAIYDAVESLTPGLATSSGKGPVALPTAPPNAALEGAIAGAAAATLQALWPRASLVAYVHARVLEARETAMASGVDPVHFAIGMAFGTAIAAAVLDSRRMDGHDRADDASYGQVPFRHHAHALVAAQPR